MAVALIQELADRLVGVRGVAGVVLGGSRARGDHAPDSDYDLGIYYEHGLDVDALRQLAREYAGDTAEVSVPGAWGPWVNGGGWLHIAGSDVDWIYRDLARVRQVWASAKSGNGAFHPQVGHPFGHADFAYVGEVAHGVVLVDPTGELADLKRESAQYPSELAEAIVDQLWEADFLLVNARKAISRKDAVFVAGCLFRVVLICAHALHARAGVWLIHEKGAVMSAGRLDIAPPGFGRRAQGILGDVGCEPRAIAATIRDAEDLVAETTAACQR